MKRAFLVALGLSLVLVAGLRGEAVVDGNQVTFRLDVSHWHDKPNRVNLAGSFNGWNKDAQVMNRVGEYVWELSLRLDDGRHEYKFVIDGERWITDSTGDRELEVHDNHGGMNSGVIVGPDIRKAPPPQPEAVNLDLVRHDPTDVRDLNVIDNQTVRFRLRTQADDVQAVRVVARDAAEQAIFQANLHHIATVDGYDHFGGLIEVPGEQITYWFELIDGDTVVRLDPESVEVALTPHIQTPEWAKHAIWYQIFPERFRNGDPANDPGDAEYERLIPWTAEWWTAHTALGEAPGAENFYHNAGNVWRRRYGGDLQGAMWALPYLRELGINAIYFNPIFEGESMHKYDTADFRHVDDNFGFKGDIAELEGETDDPTTWKWTKTDRLFLDFIQEAHRQGFKVVIDGVFNHVGRAHPFFMDVLEKGQNSQYADWFEITDWGDRANWRKMDDPFAVHGKPGGIQWRAWDGDNGHLPVFKKDPELGLAKGPRDHIFAVTRRWMDPDGDPTTNDGIDGWRLDVPGDIPHPFWRDWRKLVKQINPDAYITGEIWGEAHAWLNHGDQFDAVMNYQFAMPAQRFFVNEQQQMLPSAFAARLADLQMTYPFQVALVQQNLFDSHDTDRLASMFVNPDRPYDGANRPQDNAANWPYSPEKPNDIHWQRLKQAAVCQFTYVGAPMIYYGTETGMWSPDDPSNRQPMVWRDLLPYDDPQIEFKTDLFEHYQRLAAIRYRLKPLREGFFIPLIADDATNVLAYRRSYGDQHVYVVLNRSAEAQEIEVPIEPNDVFSPLIDWLNPDHARLVQPNVEEDPKARPSLVLAQAAGILTHDRTITITLPPYASAVLSRALE